VDVAETFSEEAEKVRRQLEGRSFDAVFSSPLQRCTKLASHCGFSQPRLDNRLMELNFGDWEGKEWNEISDPNLDSWYADWINVRTTNGESFANQLARVNNFMDELKTCRYNHVLIFTHAGVIRSLAVLLGLVQVENAFSDYGVDYGEIKKIEIK
jgi:alpha-ribazole phosphatase